MTYQLLVDNSSVVTGGTNSLILGASIILLALIVVFQLILRKLHQQEVFKYEFLTILAHKFRTPMTHIKWTLENLIPDEADPLRKKAFMEIGKSNDKLIVLMETMIELTNKDVGEKLTYTFERTVMYDFIRSITETYTNVFQEKNISLSVQCDEPDLAAKINIAGIRFVIQTLIENALLYSPTGRAVKIVVFPHHRKTCVSVIDDGIGIQSFDQKRVFSKFYRGQNARKVNTEGFGVSLFLAQSIARRNKGKIHAFSAGPNLGSTFTLILPKVK